MPKSKWCCDWCIGSCLSNAASAIAIIDLAIVGIPLAFETATVGYYLGIVHPVGLRNETCSNGNCSWIHEQVEKASIEASTSAVTTLIVFILMGAAVEGYLFTLLRQGVCDEIYKCCQKWFRLRLFLLALTVLGSVGKYLQHHYIPSIDGLFDLVKVYRVVALIIVRCYMRELARTVGIIYIEPPVRPKKGSLGQDLHLLD